VIFVSAQREDMDVYILIDEDEDEDEEYFEAKDFADSSLRE